MVVCTYGYPGFSFGEEKLVAPLIATPNVDNANRRQKKGKKLNYKIHVICMQKGIVFVFANYLDNVLVWNYAMSGLKRSMEMVGMGFVPACIYVLNSLKFRHFFLKIAKQASFSAVKMSASWTHKSWSEDQECIAVSLICKNCHWAVQTWLQKGKNKI